MFFMLAPFKSSIGTNEIIFEELERVVKHERGKGVNIIVLNAYHGDDFAALVLDGKLVAAVEEVRFNRVKH